MRGGVGRIGRKRGAELCFRQIEATAGEFLAALADVSRSGGRFASARNGRGRTRGQDFETEGGNVEIGFHAVEVRLGVTLRVHMNGRQRVWTERFGDGVA